MMPDAPSLEDLLDRMNRLCNGDASPEDLAQIEQMVRNDKELCWAYICYSHVNAGLRWAPVELRLTPGEEETEPPLIDGPFSLAASQAEPVAFPSLSAGFSSTVSYFSVGWPMAYLLATMIVGLGIAIAAVTHVSGPVQVVGPSISPSNSSLVSPPLPSQEIIGQITGMVDCLWSAG